jgi:hypothetical protein
VELDDGYGDKDDQVLHIWKKKKEKNKKMGSRETLTGRWSRSDRTLSSASG